MDRFKAVKASFLASGFTTRVHGNTVDKPKQTLKFDEIKKLVTFVHNYAEKHAILLPSRIPPDIRGTLFNFSHLVQQRR